jgi:hypothetical protein
VSDAGNLAVGIRESGIRNLRSRSSAESPGRIPDSLAWLGREHRAGQRTETVMRTHDAKARGVYGRLAGPLSGGARPTVPATPIQGSREAPGRLE